MKKKLILFGTAFVLLSIVVCAGLGIYFKDRYTVTYDLAGGIMDVNATSVKYGKNYELPFPTKQGCVFGGWYYGDVYIEAAGGSWPYDKDITLTARWVIKDEYSYTYEKVDNGYIIKDYKGSLTEYVVVPLTYSGENIVGIKDNAFARLNEMSESSETKVTLICLPASAAFNAEKLGVSDEIAVSKYNIIGDNDFLYYDNGEYLTAVCYRGSYADDIYVYDEYQGKPVRALGERLFYGAVNKVDKTSFSSFSRVMLHENINIIGADAFAKCGGLKVSLINKREDGSIREIVTLSMLFDWSQSATIEKGNEQLLDVISQIRPAFEWSIYSYAGYYVRLNANGGSAEKSELTIKRNSAYALPTPTREGYTFDGWYYGDSLVEQEGEKWSYTRHLELTAKWTENQ